MTNLNFKIDDREDLGGTLEVFSDRVELVANGLGQPYSFEFDKTQRDDLKDFFGDLDISFWKFTFFSSGVFHPDLLSIFSLRRHQGSLILHISLDIGVGHHLEVTLPTELVNELVDFSRLNVDSNS